MGLFGESLNDVYKKLADQVDASLVEGGVFKSPRLEIPLENSTLYLDTYTQSTGNSAITYTRLRCAFKASRLFEMKLYKKGFFSEMGKALGMQDIEVGQPEFDDGFIIKGDNDLIIRQVLSDYALKEALLLQEKVTTVIKNKDPLAGTKAAQGELIITQYLTGGIKDTDKLIGMIDTVKLFIEKLKEEDFIMDEPAQTLLYK